MANPEQDQQTQISFLLSDFNTRLRDLEERNRTIRERVLLIGQNLISSKEDSVKEIETMKKDLASIKKEIEKLKSFSENLVSEIDNFVKKDEVVLIEKMLKDFQPLEFARIKDVEQMINQKLGISKSIQQQESIPLRELKPTQKLSIEDTIAKRKVNKPFNI